MTYKETFELAQSKGYELLPSAGNYLYWEDAKNVYIECCLIQKWLRDTHKIHITIHLAPKKQFYWQLLDLSLDQDNTINTKLYYYTSYEQALLDSIYAALKLLP